MKASVVLLCKKLYPSKSLDTLDQSTAIAALALVAPVKREGEVSVQPRAALVEQHRRHRYHL